MAKTFEKLFTPTLNKLAVSVRYVSATPVVLQARLNDQLRHMQITKMIRKEENRRLRCLFRSGSQTLTSGRSLDYASVNKSVINVIIMYAGKLKKTFILAKSTHLQADPQQSTQVVGYKHTRKKPVDISDGAK